MDLSKQQNLARNTAGKQHHRQTNDAQGKPVKNETSRRENKRTGKQSEE